MVSTPGAVRFPANLDDADSLIRAANNVAATTLSDNPLTIGATTVTVPATAAFPASGFLSIDSEIISYTGTTSTTFTGCGRGADGTTAASHVQGVPVNHFIAAGHHNALRDALIQAETKLGSATSTPAAATFLKGTGAGTSAWSALTLAELNAILATGTVGIGFAALSNVGLVVYNALGVNANALGVDISPTVTTQNSESVWGGRIGGTLTLAATTATAIIGLQVIGFGGTATAGATSTSVKGLEIVGQATITNWTPTDVWSLFVNVPFAGTNKAVAMFKGGSSGFGTIASDRPTATLHVGQVATGTTSSLVAGIAGSTVDLAQWDASAITNGQVVHIDKNGHLAFTQAAIPTVAVGSVTWLGTTPSATVGALSTDQSGKLTINTGTSPSTGMGVIATVTFKTAYAVAPLAVNLTHAAANTGSTNAVYNFYVSSITATTFVVSVAGPATAPNASTGYVFYWEVK